MNFEHDVLIIILVALFTLATRAFPFILFGRNNEPPKLITYLGKVLPAAVIAILVVYCLRNVSFQTVSGYMPAFIAVIVTAVLHIWKRNNLISIGLGTVCYMFLVQYVF